MPEGALTVTDLFDAVMLRALDQFDERPEELTAYEWLLQVALQVLGEHAGAFEALPESLPTEAPPPEPAEEPTREDHEFWQFYQPDESLHLEDLIPDASVPDPEEQAASEEWSAAMEVHRGLAALPARWRPAGMPTCARSGQSASARYRQEQDAMRAEGVHPDND